MRELLTLTLFMLAFSAGLFAQKGLHLGVNTVGHTNWILNQQTWGQPELEYQRTYGWELGAVVGANFTKGFGIHTGVGIGRFNLKYEGLQNGNFVERIMNYEFLLVPAYLRFSPGKKHRFIFQVGPQFGFIREVEQEYDPVIESFQEIKDVTDRYRRTNVDFVVEMGPDFRLMRNLYMNLGFRASVGMMDINGEDWQIPNPDGDYEISRPARVGLTLGLRYVVFGRD